MGKGGATPPLPTPLSTPIPLECFFKRRPVGSFAPLHPLKDNDHYIVLAIANHLPQPMCNPSPWTVCHPSPARTLRRLAPSRRSHIFILDNPTSMHLESSNGPPSWSTQQRSPSPVLQFDSLLLFAGEHAGEYASSTLSPARPASLTAHLGTASPSEPRPASISPTQPPADYASKPAALARVGKKAPARDSASIPGKTRRAPDQIEKNLVAETR